jgi:hypothetical protein
MRQYVRAWITEWDLRRLDPTYEPEIEATRLVVDLSEIVEVDGSRARGDEDSEVDEENDVGGALSPAPDSGSARSVEG